MEETCGTSSKEAGVGGIFVACIYIETRRCENGKGREEGKTVIMYIRARASERFGVCLFPGGERRQGEGRRRHCCRCCFASVHYVCNGR